MKTKSYLLAALFAILILLPNTAKSATPPDSFGHEKVVLRGGLINYWNTNIPFEYLGNDVWSLQTTLVPTPDQNNSYQDIEIRVDGRDWKTGSSTFAVSTDITYTTNGNDIKITSADQGEYVITVKFTAEDKATVRFDPPGSAPTTPTVTTKAYYVLDDTPTETALGGGTINISSGNAAKSLYFKVETTEDETETATSYYSASGTWSSLTTLTKSDNQPTGITLPASQYVYTVTYGDLTDTPGNPTITITENVPQFEAIYLNGQPFVDGGDYTFAKDDELNFKAKMTDGSFVDFINTKSESLGSRTYTLTTTGTGSITAPNTASRYIYTLSIDRVSDTQWRLIVDSRTFVTAVKINGADYADGTFNFTNGQAITFTAEMSDGSTKTYKPSSATTLASGTYTLTPSGSGSITAPTDAEDYVYRFTLNHLDDNQWLLTVKSRSASEEENEGLSSTLPTSMITYTQSWSGYVPDNDDTMWYTDQLTGTGQISEMTSFLLGNGSLGICLAGSNGDYSIALSEKGSFTGNPTSISGESCGMATLSITNNSSKKPDASYIHQLDLTKAVYSAISHKGDYILGVEALASFPDQVFAMRFSDNESSNLSMTFSLAAKKTATTSGSTSDANSGSGWVYGTIDYTSYAVYYKVVAYEGTVTTSGTTVTVTNAKNIVLYLAGATNIGPLDASTLIPVADLNSAVESYASNAAAKGWSGVYADHVDDYSELYSTCTLSLDGQVNNIATDLLQSGYDAGTLTDGQKLMYEELVFAYGRYLAIAANRPNNGSVGINVPTNLQGIWVPTTGRWNGDIHADINIQMNYWASESTNLSETHTPLLKWLIAMSNTDHWKSLATECWRPKTGNDPYTYYNPPSNILFYAYNYNNNFPEASKDYVTDGWTCQTTLNPFGGATSDYYYKGGGSPGDKRYHTAQAWLCSHLIQHYLYSLDQSYAREALPTLWGACRFWAQIMHKLNVVENGEIVSYTYEVPYEASPEQDGTGSGTYFYQSGGVPHAQQMVYYLFKNTIDMIEKVGLPSGASTSQYKEIKEIFDHLDNGLHVWTSGGQQYLREWKYLDTFGDEKEHRHLSHLCAMFPLGQIKPDDEVFGPTINAMISRGLKVGNKDAAVWTTSWKVGLWAHAGSSDTYNQYAADIYKSTIGNYSKAPAGTGLYTNLTSYNMCMQMEGNWGLTAGVAEMLMQSNMGEVLRPVNPYGYIDIAPALPTYWPTGKIEGLKAIGNYEVSYEWENGVVQKVTVTAKANNPVPFFVHFKNLSNSTYHVSEISGAERNTTFSDDIWDSAHAWKFTPSRNGSYVVITLGAGEDVQPDPDPEPEYDAVLYGPTAPVPNTVGIQTVMQGSTPLMRVMFGTKEAMYYDSSSKTFMDGGVTWTKQGSEALDGSISIDALEGYAAGSAYQSDKSALPFTEVNGQMAAQNTKNGGMFLTPISGDFLRLEPLYTGTATLWLRQTGSLYVMDEDGKVIDVATKSSNVSAQATDGGYSVTGDNQKVKYTIAVKGGKTYYVGTRDHALGFTAAAFAKADYTAADYYLESDADVSSQTWPATGATVNYTVHREFTAGYCHPIVLPFSVSESKFLDVFGEGAVAVYLDPYPNSSKDDDRTYMSAFMPAIGNNTLYFTVHYYQMLYANVPAFVIPARLVTDPTFHDVTYAGNVIRDYTLDANGNFTVTGSYTSTTAADNKEMYFINNTGGSSNTVRVYHSAEGVDMKPLRAWISARSTTTQAPPRINGVGFHSFPDGDDVAYIADIVSDDLPTVADDRVYNLLGIPVAIGTTEGLAPGIYIHRGAKVLVR